jgi:hypothetical protein
MVRLAGARALAGTAAGLEAAARQEVSVMGIQRAEGTSVRAKLQVRFTDPLGNTALDKSQVKLTGTSKVGGCRLSPIHR